MGFRRERRFLDHTAPADITGIDEVHVGKELTADGRANAIGSDHRFPADFRTVGEANGDAVGILRKAGNGRTAPDALLWEDGREHRVEPRPGRAELRHADFTGDAAIPVESGTAADRYADAAIDMGAGGEQPLQHGRMHAETGAATLEPALAPLDDGHVPARSQQVAAGEQPAEGTSNYDCTPHQDCPVRKEEAPSETMPSG